MWFRTLFTRGWSHPNPLRRRWAAHRTIDPQVLTAIAKYDSDSEIRVIAIKKLNDQSVLAEIAVNDGDWQIRESAVARITDQNILSEIAKIDNDHHVRVKAVEKLTNQATLIELFRTETNANVINAIENSRICNTSDYHDIDFLSNRKMISISARGESLYEISVAITNLFGRQININIPTGCIFNGYGKFQNMAVCRAQSRMLLPKRTFETRLRAVCVNARLRVPQSNDVFAGFVERNDAITSLLKRMPVEIDKETLQMAVWIITDRIACHEARVLFGVDPFNDKGFHSRYFDAEQIVNKTIYSRY